MKLTQKESYKLVIRTALCIAVCAIYFLFYCMGFRCLFLKYTGIICPGCGMSRAGIALIHGEFLQAFYYHPMIYFMPVIALYIIFDGHIFKKKLHNKIILSCIIIGFMITYILKLLIKNIL